MHGAVSSLHAELNVAIAQEMRLRNATDAAEQRSGGAFAQEVGCDAARDLARAAYDFAHAAEVLVWRTASACTVLGISVLDRVVAGRPPLAEDVVERLCEEPSLGAFEAAVSIPVERLLLVRDATMLGLAREDRQKMALLVEQAYESLEDEKAPAPMDRAAAAGARLSVDAPEGFDPPWVGCLDALVGVARQTPHEISHYLKRRPAAI